MKNLFKYFQKDKEKFIFCLFTTSNDIEFLINRYENIISKFISVNKSFYIFKFKINNENSKKYKSKIKKCKIIEVHNKKQFNDIIKGKHLFAIDDINRGLKFFNIRRLINQNNISLILIMNIGYLSNNSKIDNANISLLNKFFNVKKFFERYFCRLLILFDIYPKTQFYFDSNKKIVDNYKKSLIRKFAEKTKLSNLLLNFQIVENVNSSSIENFHTYKHIKKKQSILFIDGNYKHKDILQRDGKNIIKNQKKYISALKIYLKYLGKILDLKICIALHPSSNFKEYKKLFPKFKITKWDTIKQIYESPVVVFHESSAIVDALIAKKKIISFETKLLGKYLYNRIKLYKNTLNLFNIDIDVPIDKSKLSKNRILRQMKLNKKKLDNYVFNHLKSDSVNFPSEKIIKVIFNYTFK